MSTPLLAFPLEGSRIAIHEADGPAMAAIVRLADAQAVGTLLVSNTEPGVLFIDRLCIEDPHRGYGAGSEAARLVIDAAESTGYRLLRAWAPPDLGLAVYFWFRMGLHPLHGEGPDGGIWLERKLG